jgi:Domain of unknown function (DUF5666)
VLQAPAITGTLVATPGSTPPTALLLQVGSQTLKVNITVNTVVVGRNDAALPLNALQDADSVRVIGRPEAGGQIAASRVRDLTRSAVTAPKPTTLQGVLAATPSSITAPTTLCVRNASVTNAAMQPQISTVSPCPTGQLPVAVTTSTQIVRRYNGKSGLDELSAGDRLELTGTFVNTVFTASVVKDVSIQDAYSTLVGTISYISPMTTPPYFTVRAQRDAHGRAPFQDGQVLTVDVQPGTQLLVHGTTTNQITALNPGEVVTVLGTFDRHSNTFTTTNRVRVH